MTRKTRYQKFKWKTCATELLTLGGSVCVQLSLDENRKRNHFKGLCHIFIAWAQEVKLCHYQAIIFKTRTPAEHLKLRVYSKCWVGVPVLGDEGSHTLDESLYVLETCSDNFFLVLPLVLWCFFLFFTKIFPISSIGLGSGTPGSSWKRTEGWGVEAKRRRIERMNVWDLKWSVLLLFYGFGMTVTDWLLKSKTMLLFKETFMQRIK